MTDENNLRYNQFIEKLYTSPSSTPQDKERIVKLLLSEREKGFVTEEKIKEMIQMELGHINIELGKDNIAGSKEVSKEFKYIPPYYLSDFLYEYNQDPVLRYTCHKIDSIDVIEDICDRCGTKKYDLMSHQQLIFRHYNDLLQRYKVIDFKVKSLMYAYITGTNIKTGEKEKWASQFEDNWGCENIKTWALENPGLVPNPGENIQRKYNYDGYPLSRKYISPITQKRVIGFDGLVLCFKSMFHIKRDNSLEDIIAKVEDEIKTEHPNIIFGKENFHNEIELFTNVLNLKRAYEKIVKMCIESGGGKEIIKSFYHTQSGDKCFVITDKNSVFKKTIEDTIDRPGESTTDIIKSQVNGMCNLYLWADFPDGKSYYVNLWDGNKCLGSEQKEKVGGVKYIFEFKKSRI